MSRYEGTWHTRRRWVPRRFYNWLVNRHFRVFLRRPIFWLLCREGT